jgi:glucose-1-phosphate thymidylyltransferase
MKGILLAGGKGTRLYPLSQVVSKQLLPVYDKPMIYYPLTVLMAAGIREFCLISTPSDLIHYQNLLGDGHHLGITITYLAQPQPRGIAEVFLIAQEFIGTDSVCLILGDNLFLGGDAFPRAAAEFKAGATLFAYQVQDPQHYGVVELSATDQPLSLEEKPTYPKSSYAIPGLYLYDSTVIEYAKTLSLSARGEYEITDINQCYLNAGTLQVRRLSRGLVWLDAGTPSRLYDASTYIQTLEKRQGIKIGCPEEAAWVRKFISHDQFQQLIHSMPSSDYRYYLESLLKKQEKP